MHITMPPFGSIRPGGRPPGCVLGVFLAIVLGMVAWWFISLDELTTHQRVTIMVPKDARVSIDDEPFPMAPPAPGPLRTYGRSLARGDHLVMIILGDEKWRFPITLKPTDVHPVYQFADGQLNRLRP